MEEAQKLLESSKLSFAQIRSGLVHPVLETADYKPRDFVKKLYGKAKSFFKSEDDLRMVGLAGLRGTGKTSLLLQTAEHIHIKYSKNVYYFNLNDLAQNNVGIREIHQAFDKFLANSESSNYKEKTVFLLDDVEGDPNWVQNLKNLYNKFFNVFIIATGCSYQLMQSATELSGLMSVNHITPIRFTEYISAKQNNIGNIEDMQENLKQTLFYSKSLEMLENGMLEAETSIGAYYSKIAAIKKKVSDYLIYHNMVGFCHQKKKAKINAQLNDLVQKVICEDIPKITRTKHNEKKSEIILRKLAAADKINIKALSRATKISEGEINETLDNLVKAELLSILYSYDEIAKRRNKTPQYFFTSPSIRNIMANPMPDQKMEPDLFAKLVLDTVVLSLKVLFEQEDIISFTSSESNSYPNLIIDTIDKPIIVEVGLGENTIKQLQNYHIDYKYAIVINWEIEEPDFYDNIVILPLKYFFML